MFPSFVDQKRTYADFEHHGVGVGSLESWYEEDVGTVKARKREPLPNHTLGPLPLFPKLDVMPGSSSAVNDAYVFNLKNFESSDLGQIDPAVMHFEEITSAFNGFRTFNNLEFKDENLRSVNPTMGVFDITGENIDEHAAQSQFGKHQSADDVKEKSAKVAIQSNVGDNQEARDAGLERAQNEAINGSGGEQVYHNSEVLPKNVPAITPVDIDAIEINGEVQHVEDTAQALDLNVSAN